MAEQLPSAASVPGRTHGFCVGSGNANSDPNAYTAHAFSRSHFSSSGQVGAGLFLPYLLCLCFLAKVLSLGYKPTWIDLPAAGPGHLDAGCLPSEVIVPNITPPHKIVSGREELINSNTVLSGFHSSEVGWVSPSNGTLRRHCGPQKEHGFWVQAPTQQVKGCVTLGSVASEPQFPYLRNAIISILQGLLKGQVRHILKSAQSDKSEDAQWMWVLCLSRSCDQN